jgi:trans-2,3-dihydro-3-hydroxyanthranilate isomerase
MLGLPLDRVRADLPVQAVSAGNPLLAVPLVDKGSVDAAVLDQRVLQPFVEQDPAVGVFLFAQTPDGTYARLFAPTAGIPEDPATGSATGPLYVYLLEHGALQKRTAAYVSEQGVKLGRRGVLHVRVNVSGGELESVDVGGRAIHVGTGTITLPRAESRFESPLSAAR